jgi:DNA primase
MDGLTLYKKLFKSHDHLDRATLPYPLQYLTQRDLINGKQRGEWATIRCPAHKGGAESNPSLRVSLIDGHYKCMACGAAGGDLIALHRLITGLGFREAVQDMGGKFHD